MYLRWFSKRTTVNLHLVRGFSSLPRLIVADLPLTLLVSRVWIPLSHPTMDSEGGWVPTMIPGPTGKLHVWFGVLFVESQTKKKYLIPLFFLVFLFVLFSSRQTLETLTFSRFFWYRMCQGFTWVHQVHHMTIPCISPCSLRAPSWTMRLKS